MKGSVYVSAPYEMIEEARSLAAWLSSLGHEVTSSWLREGEGQDDAENARMDLCEVLAADWFLALNPAEWKRSGTGGRHVELGYALAFSIPVVILGVRSNVFHHLPDIRVIERIEDL